MLPEQKKYGSSRSLRAQPGWSDDENPYPRRWERATVHLWADARSAARRDDGGNAHAARSNSFGETRASACSPTAHGRGQSLWFTPVQAGFETTGHSTRDPAQTQPEARTFSQCQSVPGAKYHRAFFRSIEALSSSCHPLRQTGNDLSGDRTSRLYRSLSIVCRQTLVTVSS